MMRWLQAQAGTKCRRTRDSTHSRSRRHFRFLRLLREQLSPLALAAGDVPQRRQIDLFVLRGMPQLVRELLDQRLANAGGHCAKNGNHSSCSNKND